MFKRFIYILLSVALTSCINPSLKNSDGFVVKDMLGREVNVPKEVNKVVGIRAGALRLLLYCGANDMIAGIEETERRPGKLYMDAYPELKDLPVIGPAMGGDAELILKAQPDVIFISYTTIADADALQEKIGIPVVAIECPEFATEKDKLFDSFRLIGNVINKTERVDSLISFINNSLHELDERTKNNQGSKPTVYIGSVPYSGSHGINSTQPFYPPFIFTNSRNVASSIDKSLVSHVKGTFIDKEQLLLWNPDFLFIDKSGLSIVKSDLSKGTALFQSLKAIQNGNIYTLYPYNNYAVNYEMVLVNSWYVASVLYPEEFYNFDFSEKANEIVNAFLGDKMDAISTSLDFKKLNKTDF
jgi:iron complex transport system substrate-binding protein